MCTVQQAAAGGSHTGEVRGAGGGVGRQKGMDKGWRGVLCLLWKEFGSQNFVNRMIFFRENFGPEIFNTLTLELEECNSILIKINLIV